MTDDPLPRCFHLEFDPDTVEARASAVLHAEAARAGAPCPSCLLVLLACTVGASPELAAVALQTLGDLLRHHHGAATAIAFDAVAFRGRPGALARLEALERLPDVASDRPNDPPARPVRSPSRSRAHTGDHTMTDITFEHVEEAHTLIARGPAALAPGRLGLLAAAVARLAHAYDFGHHGDHVSHRRFAYETIGVLAAAPDPETVHGARRGARIARALRGSRVGVPPDALACPIAFASTAGVPARQLGDLCAFARLCLDVADGLAGLVIPGDFDCLCLTTACDDAPPDPVPAPRFAGVLATRLDHPGLLEYETRCALIEIFAGLVAGRGDLRPWVPLDRDPTVRLREPDDHPGLPLLLIPFVMEGEAARRALDEPAVARACRSANAFFARLGAEPGSPDALLARA